MQLVMDERMEKGGVLQFARNTEQDYMIRSEKRPGYRSGSGGPGKRKKRKKKKRASAGYVFMTFLMLIVLFPIGLVMLWMRKIRWSVMSKLILTVVFASMFVLSTSFLLTVPVENNEMVSNIQAGARNGLAKMGTNVQEAWQRADVTPERMWKDAQDIAGHTIQLQQRALVQGFPVVVEKVQGFGENVQQVASHVASLAVTGGKGLIDKASSLIPRESTEPATPDITLLPTPDVTEIDPTPAPTPPVTPTPSPEPTPAGVQAWYGEGDSLYHLDPDCKQLLVGNLNPMSITEAVELGLMPCQLCANPDKTNAVTAPKPSAETTPEPSVEPEASTEPVNTGEWVSFTGEQDKVVSVINDSPAAPSLADSTFEPTPVEPSPDPSAIIVVDSTPTSKPTATPVVTVTPTQEPEAEPEDEATAGTSTAAPTQAQTTEPTATPVVTPTPTPTVKPTPTLAPSPTPVVLPQIKAAAEIKVYYTGGGKYYHVAENCGSMKGAPVHTLKQAVDNGKSPCPYCHAYEKNIAEKTNLMWCDKDDVYHTTDECEKFSGTVQALKSLGQAIEDGDKACTECGADLYAKAD